jgi:hypothetical protein
LRRLGRTAGYNLELDVPADQASLGRSPSHWVMLTDKADVLTELEGQPGWRPAECVPGVRAWTDDYSNLLTSLKFR